MDIETELTTIQREYASYFSQCVYVAESAKKAYYPLRSTSSHLHIITKEGKELKVTVSVAGWCVVDENTRFQTFEALMNHESPAFCLTFADNLTKKLEALQ